MDWSRAPEGVLHRIAEFAAMRDLDSRRTFPFVCKAFRAVWPPFQRTRFDFYGSVWPGATLNGRTLLLQETGSARVIDATDGALLLKSDSYHDFYHLYPYRLSPNGETLLHMSRTEGLTWTDPRRPSSPAKATVSAAQLRELMPKREPHGVDALSIPGLALVDYAYNWNVVIDGRGDVAKTMTFSDDVCAVTNAMVVTVGKDDEYKLYAFHDAARPVRTWTCHARVLCWIPLPTGGVRAIYIEGSYSEFVCEATLDLEHPVAVVRRACMAPSSPGIYAHVIRLSLDERFVVVPHEEPDRVIVHRVTDFGIVARIDRERGGSSFESVYSMGVDNRVHAFARTRRPCCHLITFPSVEASC